MDARYTEIIDKYLTGQLKGEELKAFKEKLKTDPQLQKELKLEKDLNPIILDEETLDFRKEVMGIRKEMQQQHESNRSQQTVSITSRKWYLLAASIVVLVGLLGYLYFIQNQQISNEKLFAQYYSKYPADISERSGDELSHDPYILGLTEYSENNFMDALPYLIIAIDEDSLNFPAHLYLGIIYLETNALPDAIKTFKTIIANPDNIFTNQAKWYLALAYLKSNNKTYQNEIKSLLQSIARNNGDRAKEAQKLLDKMK